MLKIHFSTNTICLKALPTTSISYKKVLPVKSIFASLQPKKVLLWKLYL